MTETTIKQQRNFYPTTDSPPLSVHSNSPLHNAPQQLDLMCDGEMPPPPPPHNNNNSHLVPSCQQKEQIAGMVGDTEWKNIIWKLTHQNAFSYISSMPFFPFPGCSCLAHSSRCQNPSSRANSHSEGNWPKI